MAASLAQFVPEFNIFNIVIGDNSYGEWASVKYPGVSIVEINPNKPLDAFYKDCDLLVTYPQHMEKIWNKVKPPKMFMPIYEVADHNDELTFPFPHKVSINPKIFRFIGETRLGKYDPKYACDYAFIGIYRKEYSNFVNEHVKKGLVKMFGAAEALHPHFMGSLENPQELSDIICSSKQIVAFNDDKMDLRIRAAKGKSQNDTTHKDAISWLISLYQEHKTQ